MKVLVTGSAGFIGTHLVRALTARGDVVLGADKKQGVDLTNFAVAVDLLSWEPDIVVHLASTCSTPASVERPMETFSDTVLTAVNILEAARARKTPVILTSSVKARDGRTPYGAAKRMAETWAQEYAAAYGMTVVINRPGTVYGPGQEGSAESGWIAWFLKAKRERLPVTVNGSGDQMRDLLHVSDYVRLLLLQIDQPDRYANGIWDVGGGAINAVTVNEMVRHLHLRASHGDARYGDSDIYVGENDAPGWQPKVVWYETEMFG